MTKKDYIKLAEVMNRKVLIAFPNIKHQEIYYALLNKLVRTLKADNPRFNADKFMQAIG